MRLLALTRTNLKNYHLQKKGSFNHIIYIFGKATLGILRTGVEVSPGGEGYRVAGKSAGKSSKDDRGVCGEIVLRKTRNCGFNYT